VAVTIVRQRDLEAKLRDAAFAKLFSAASSPAAVASELGVTREAIYDLLRRGRLDAIRLVSDRGPRKLLAVLIPAESVGRYRATRYQRAAS
jgi:transposase